MKNILYSKWIKPALVVLLPVGIYWFLQLGFSIAWYFVGGDVPNLWLKLLWGAIFWSTVGCTALPVGILLLLLGRVLWNCADQIVCQLQKLFVKKEKQPILKAPSNFTIVNIVNKLPLQKYHPPETRPPTDPGFEEPTEQQQYAWQTKVIKEKMGYNDL